MRNNAIITPQVLIWAREHLDLSLKAASEYLKLDQDKLLAWEEGRNYPTVRQAKDIAKKYKIPYFYFFLPEPPKNIKLPKNQDYRTFSNQPIKTFSIELKTLLFDIIQRREAMLQLNNELSVTSPVFSYFFDVNITDENIISEAIRNILNFSNINNIKKYNIREAFNYFKDSLEKIGVLVFQAIDIEPFEMRGIYVFDEVLPIIVVNRKDSYNARIFTLMHEFVHLITKTAGICDSNGFSELTSLDIEIKCNHIAAQALVPDNLIKNNHVYLHLLNDWNDDAVRVLGNTFTVSREVILSRLLSFENINRRFYKQKLDQYTQEYFKSKTKEETGGYPTPSIDAESQFGKTYISTVLTAYNQEVISARDAIQYFDGLRLKHFDKLERWCFA